MELTRCDWCLGNELYINYHDEEWGVPVHDDLKMFEFIILETFQAGLSWLMILKKRENFRKAFEGFNFEKIADFDEAKIQELMNDKSIVRNKLKIKAAVTNAKSFIDIRKEFGSFNDYLWGFFNFKTLVNYNETLQDVPSKNEVSDRIAKDLKKRGFKFMGSTVVYAHLQAVGIINDHLCTCFRYGALTNQ